ncbi:probable serine/threonine-protein kinase DDB_G0282963 isoform X1 [Anopheles gambiae]|uniref:probable serine/threonine-protein kinase DDB_G0282963 isoform X1 n=1 Tax=Anopheles gambiae TaxID=7165 RepID=UPI002AC8E99F|nr:probable serine/threonine-protein kinase DDB_G0282963 isoform X1 [Anopheles gambiae]XP_061519335.1 probable serine/threonine-protein kinase DDB_G0282963 isoform X1 [Anopheles gambiae]XP_061519340.1 probable serine/threonine-protein kinase DDB_G0282963 isoform X1 [Anopheles gambiae]XP_061519348.1 probable serine/threonine-protein kinase DDB_G0282963 isoform X1 [Anopheles gambiae]XP_061519359.1 probable serine/threonine-protein kinase DDB_G0282963 isoform X1 [Anopheles gambiae]XP_061519364.1 
MNTSATTNTNNKINISNNNAINDKSNTTASYQSSSAMLLSTPPRRGTKRKIASVANGNSPAIRKRRKLQHSSKAGESRLEQVPQTKNTVAVLNELKRNLVYKVESQTGPVHAPIFTISVVVDGQKFVGTGPSKKLARVAAAASALRSFIQFKDGATLTPIEPLQNVDFTSDDPMIENSIFPLSDAVVGPGVPQEKVAGAPVATGGSCGGKPAAVPESATVNSNHSLHSNNSSNSSNNTSKTPYSSSGCINNNNNNNNNNSGANRAAAAAGVAATNNSRQCDISGNNTTVHSNSHTTTNNSNTANSSHSSAIGPTANSNGSNWHRKDAAATAAAADGEKQQQQQQHHHHHHHQSAQDKPSAVGTVSNHNHNNNANASVRTAPAAASSIVTNIAATGTTYNDSYEQYIGVSAGGTTTTTTTTTATASSTITTTTGTDPKTSNAAISRPPAGLATFPTVPSLPPTPSSPRPAAPGSTNHPLAGTAATTHNNTISSSPLTHQHANTGNHNTAAATVATTTSTAILMLPLAGYVMASGPRSGNPLLGKPVCTTAAASTMPLRPDRARDAKPNEPAAPYRKLKAKSGKAALSAASDFHRFVNYIQYDTFALNGSKKQQQQQQQHQNHPHQHHHHHHNSHHNYFNKFGNFDTSPINSYHLSLVRSDATKLSTAANSKANGKDGLAKHISTSAGGGGGGGSGGAGGTSNNSNSHNTITSTSTPTTTTTILPSTTNSIANGSTNPAAAAIVIVTSASPTTTTALAASSTGVGGDKGYVRDGPGANHHHHHHHHHNHHTVSYPFPNTTAIPPALTSPYAQNGHRQVVEKIQQSLNLFKNTNEKALAWKKRFEKLKVSSGSTLRNSGNVAAGHHPKPQPEKGPVMLLHELFTDAHFECVSSDGLQHSKFTVVVTVNDNQRFEGTGPSKKMAKNAAAKAALASICNISFSPLQQSKFGLISAGTSNGSIGGPSGVALNGDNSFTQNKNFELPQTFADAVGKLVIEKFNEVMKGSDVYSRRKVLAGFVMTHGYDIKTARVISLATGTKCVSGEHMSVTGSVINDSHAEIIARRGLMDFFYSQLDLLCQQQQQQAGTVTAEEESASSVPPAAHDGTATAAAAAAAAPVVAVPSGGQEADPNAPDRQARQEIIFNTPKDGSNLYTLKDGIYFHLYINTAPCGDARVFSPHENDSMDVDKHPNRKARGQLRTKVESGEGTIPVKSSDGIQTWDGVLQGQRLLTMSCSDKISRWNVLGLQGSLLASIIEPIYLHSIVLGSLLHPAHMYRAICGRIESAIQGLPPPYRLNKPKLALMTSAESRNQTKPPNFSINWITNGTEVEIVNSFTGKLINNNTNTNKMSRLSKQSFYQRYSTVIAGLPGIPLREVKPTYFETKMSVAEYQQAKRELFAAFSKEDLGEWLKKPIEQDQFTLIVAKECSELGPQQALPQQAQQPQPPPYANQPQTVPMPADANTAAVGNVSSIGNSSK